MNYTPVIPFEPISTSQLPSGNEWIAQIKWDGVRILTYFDGQSVRLINRRLNERTRQYPELQDIGTYCSADSVILDGEIIALEEGSPSFHKVMKRDSLKNDQKVLYAVNAVPVHYMVFDVLYCNGEWVTNQSLRERQQLLDTIIRQPHPIVQVVPSYTDLQPLDTVAKEHQLEGIVLKNLDSTYVINGKDKRWMKKKYIQDLIAVVGGVTRRAGTVNALLLGLYDDQQRLIYIGHAGTGKLTVQDWKKITGQAEELRIEERPFANIPERSKEAVWIQPLLTVKIHFMEWTPNGTLRQPSIQSFTQIPPEDCYF
ncbi:non-homologous end-joining DNA ligase [Paenibacillus lutrae]|uniref:DNA ligase (ATP) n=1 Tax=Paenibacillus lutrae TaxID=2078573 RepID=A0A7X3FLC6_9BACL|nr:non-homologous end-joining DNA ligase [Paenibacillus lutrae]MVP01427.1 DNA ligase [Paenibacillus lutrae]